MTDYSTLIKKYGALWETCEITPSRRAEVVAVAKRLVSPSAKAQYEEIEKVTTVPWWVIAVIHEREADQNFFFNIAQGDPWNKISRHVPKGRGPFRSFFDAAVDALVHCPPYAARWNNWSPGGMLVLLMLYNGLGYETFHHENSPYDWGATNHQQRGKYIADGQYSHSAWDSQIGCAAMLRAMMELDPSIKFAEAEA